MKILMLLSNPMMVDPRVYIEAKTLVDAGHSVVVIAWDRKNNYTSEDNIDGIRVIRIKNMGFMRIAPHDLLRNPLWWWTAYRKSLELYYHGFQFDVVHCHDLDTLPSGVALKNRLGMKLVYDAHEIFGNMLARSMPWIVVKITFWLEKILAKQVDHIITVNDKLEEYFKTITDKPTSIVMNCKDLIIDEYQPSMNKVFTIVYIGVLHHSRMFPEIVDIIGTLDDIRFIIAGKQENLFEEVKKRSENYDNIDFIGSIPYNQVLPQTLAGDVVICMINPTDKNNRIGLANKQFEAMVCGRPIICTKDTYSGKMTEELKCGITVGYNEKELKNGINKLKTTKDLCIHLGMNALNAAKSRYNWATQKDIFLNIYKNF